MKKNVLITGANGFIAKNISKLLQENYNVRFLTRRKTNDQEYEWNIDKQEIDVRSLKDVNHIIHLAGANIGEKRWTKERKKLILSSRIDSAKLILNTLIKENISIESFISASAIGYYGTLTSNKIFAETDKHGADFLSHVCLQWENIADEFKTKNIAKRVIKIRTGVTLSEDSNGALFKIKTPIQYHLGACLGSGKQYMPWIHIKDLCSIYKYALENINLEGAYNAVSPEHTTNKDLTYSIAKHLNKRIWLPNIPSFFIQWVMGERANLLLEGNRISAHKLLESGFYFRYKELDDSLKSLLQ
ncbi:TIGR01777 family protein [Apibacter muscae]|uniref:TIGR01777 family oxidoreductase n=1 Tax=Apibacter muscae TaxID=2509004 RepID=UPI0011AD52D6|nr:TIGR01777 family oxidoreductase [Apibacter muscae]TWP30145.1 TIGR01777 family protein [Apibacter muscae]